MSLWVASRFLSIVSIIIAFLPESCGKLPDGANNQASTSFSEKFLGIFTRWQEQGHKFTVLY